LTGIQPGERAVGLLHVGYPQNIPSISVRTPITEKIVFFETDTGIQIPDVFRFKAEDKNVLWNLPSMTKEDAITCAGEKLKELGYADDYFVQSMHEKEGFKNTYLGNGVATPHGSKVAKEKVRISGAVILHFPEGISYENETVYIMIAIAAQKYIHMQILSTAVKICENENHVYNLRTSNSKESFIELFNQFSMG
jgi:mannitol/fructose-specific phosphotransferase system IIA component